MTAYEIDVCPRCGAQATYGGYEEGWEFSCDHYYELLREVGDAEPLRITVEPTESVTAAIAAHAPELERLARQKAVDDARREAERKARWDALTPEQQAQERRTSENFARILRESWFPMLSQVMEQNSRMLFKS